MITIFRHFFFRMSRDRGLPAQSFAFFMLAILACVFAIGSEDVLLAATIPGLVWALMLLASLLGLGDLLDTDELDDLILAKQPLPALMLAKMLAHWLATGLPMAILAPFILKLLLPTMPLPLDVLWFGFVPGSLAFSASGVVGAALTLGSRRNAALQALIVLPLCVPALIFGAGGIAALQLDLGWQAPLAFVAAFACASLTLAPFAAAWIIRMKVTQ